MERRTFIHFFNKAANHLDKKRMKKIVRRAIASAPDKLHEYIVVMEELAELSQQTSKAARGRCDKMNLTEEMADVIVCLMRLQELCDIETLDLYKAINVKVDRLEYVLNTEGVYL